MEDFGFVADKVADNKNVEDFGFVADSPKQTKPEIVQQPQPATQQPETPVLTGGVEKKYTQNWDKKGRIYYTDEQGNRVDFNVPFGRKIGNKLRATASNVRDWIEETNPESEAYKQKANVALTLATLPMGLGKTGTQFVASKLTPILGRKVGLATAQGIGSGLVSGGVYGTGEALIEGENPVIGALQGGTIGALTGGALGGGVAKVSRNVKAKNLRKQRAERPQTEVIKPVEEVIEQAPKKETLNDYKARIRDNKFEQGNLKDHMIVNKGKKGYTSSVADPVSYDMEVSQREFNKIITEISKNPEKLNEVGYLDDLEKRVQDIVDKTPYGNEEEVAMQYWDKFWKSVDDGNNYNEFKVNRGKKTVEIPQETGDIKQRSLEQSVLKAKGTPEEVKDIIKNDLPQYRVLHNNELTEQAVKEIEANFDNELSRLTSSKDFEALDYEKSRQIAKRLFDLGRNEEAVNLIDNVSENATKKGQAIQALSLWSNMTPEGAVAKANKLLKEYNKKHKGKEINLTDKQIEDIRNLQNTALSATDDVEKAQGLARTAKYISELVPSNFAKKLKAYRNISLLLNPKTLGRNIVGNALFNTFDNISKAVAAPIDLGISKFTGQRTRALPNLKAYGKGMLQGAKTGFKESLEGIDTRGLGQRYDLQSGRVFKNPFMRGLETALDVGLRTPDRAFYEATFAESVDNMMRASAPQRQITKANLQKKLARAKSEKSIEKLNKQIADLDKPTQEMLEQAEREALEAVFQNESKISDLALTLRRGMNKLGTKDFGLGDLAVPYAQTPANLAQQGINYSPLGAINFARNLAQGNQRQASLDLARSLVGTGLGYGGYLGAKQGLITPSQFDDNYQTNKTIKENLQPLGIRPDQLGDYWYAPFQPMSIPVSVGTATYYGESPVQAGVNTIVDLPFLQNVSRGLSDIKDKGIVEAGINFASSVPSQFVPTGLSQVAQTIDPYQRETYDPNRLQQGLNQAITKIPFASQTLPQKIDVTGQPVERYQTTGGKRLFDIFLNPTFINKKTNDPVLSELKNIYDVTKETKHFMPTVKKKLKFTDVDGNPQSITLTGKEFSAYQRRLGNRMYEEFDYIMSLPEYYNSDEYDKIKMLSKAKELVKAEVDNEMWNKRNRNRRTSYTKGY